ncbi:MAG: FAD-dependent oxidoreductase [Gammaproteobacteria bacterium]|nr:FAD-dependent oxidoreductase [Gammaproteobacteria bacterium]
MVNAVECVVVGSGVVGLACARALARQGREVVVLERHTAIGTETSARNSEVIHAGIYYPAGSLKARLCAAGKQKLYDYCASRQVPHRACGKLIVASADAQIGELHRIADQAAVNGVALRWLGGDEVTAMEPAVKAVAGLHSPTTGIVDSHAFMVSLQGELEQAGGVVAFAADVQQIRSVDGGIRVQTADAELHSRWLVNCAGLHAPRLASQLIDVAQPSQFAVGHYYAYSGAAPFNQLVYPVPEPGGLGIHVTLDLAGHARFGPDVVWRDTLSYDFPTDEAALRSKFAAAIREYFPALEESRLYPSYTGIRPKIVAEGQAAGDFVLHGPSDHGVAGFINLMGIESPGLTSALAIGERVVGMTDA